MYIYKCGTLPMVRLFFITFALCLSSCADFNRMAYNGFQENRRQSCYKLIGHQQQDCLARLTTSYDDYERARKDKN